MMRVLTYLMIVYCGFVLGQYFGFKKGYDESGFDRDEANKKIRACLVSRF